MKEEGRSIWGGLGFIVKTPVVYEIGSKEKLFVRGRGGRRGDDE